MPPSSEIHLTSTQRQAVEHDGSLVVIAGPGSGKTELLARRAAHLAQTGRRDPFSLLILAFSAKAAREMRSRIAEFAPDVARLMTITTEHAFGLRVIREFADLLGFPTSSRGQSSSRRRRPRVISGGERDAALARAMRSAGEDLRLAQTDVGAAISQAKSTGSPPDDPTREAQGASADPIRKALAACYAAYQVELRSMDAVDFDDMLLLPLQLIRAGEEARSFYRQRYRHILVDEFQDFGAAQYELIRHIASDGGLTVIGDPMQSVYGWRGAMGGEGFDRVKRDCPSARLVFLEENWRSRVSIVALGNAIAGEARPSQTAARSHTPGAADEPVNLVRCGSERDEAAWIASQILLAASTGAATPGQIAVLCRTRAQLDLVEHALLEAKLPCAVAGRGSFFVAPEVRHVLAYLALSQDVMDDWAARQIVNAPPRGLTHDDLLLLQGEDAELAVWHLADRERVEKLDEPKQRAVRGLLDDLAALERLRAAPPSQVLAHILVDGGLRYRRYLETKTDFAERLERVRQLCRMAEPHETVASFLDEIDVMTGQDPLVLDGAERVSVMTLHDAKGLEFPVVFVCGVEEGVLPHHNSLATPESLRQERNLALVGVTRARDRLIVTYARERDGRPAEPSRFLRGLPRAHIVQRPPVWERGDGAAGQGR